MKFMGIRKADAETEAGVMPDAKLIDDMTAYNAKLVQAGVMLSGDGLFSSSRGARVSFRDGKPTVIDGPFAEAKELIAGYSILELPSLEAAIDWWTSRKRAAAGATPSLTGPDMTSWRRAWALGDRRGKKRRGPTWPEL